MATEGDEHLAAMNEAIRLEGEAHRALLAGDAEGAGEPLRAAAERYRASWEAAPPGSYGRLIGMLKALVIAGDDALGRGAAAGMLAGSEPFRRAADAIDALARGDGEAYAAAAAAIVADFEGRTEHLTGVPIADTALMLERLAERRSLAAHPASALLPAG